MKRLTIAVLLLALLPVATAVADNQECMTADVEWVGQQPALINVHHAAVGVRTAIVGDYLWTQYNTSERWWEDEHKQVLSTLLPVGVAHVEACPDGLVTLTSPPVQNDDAELGAATVVIDVVAFWMERGYHNYGPTIDG